MNNIISEKDYQKFLINYLENNNGYKISYNNDYIRKYSIDSKMLFTFLKSTQPKEMEALYKVYKEELEDVILSTINREETKKGGSRLSILKHGVDIANHHLNLMYVKPATTFNKELSEKYNNNIFSVAEEIWASDDERIDVVIFLNGIAIMTFELKCEFAGQSYKDAIFQYREERNPKTRLFRFKAGSLVCFAMDLNNVYMTTKLENESTYFLPFNMGSGEGINAGAGNPINKDDYSVSYMWKNILQKDSILEIINKFMFIEVKKQKDNVTEKEKIKETVIFPRYHQLDVIRKLLDDLIVNKTSQNYLLQHSTGSGKTNEIAWLAHRLVSLHSEDNKSIFDNIVVCTDRVVVDRQLQDAIRGIEHKSGLIKVLNENCTSDDLRIALEGNTKIVATTIQKFPYILDAVKPLSNKKFAVIIDEAHSSTAGKNMAAVTKVLGGDEEYSNDVEDMIVGEIKKSGKQSNVSMFAFTATPKSTTLELFGRPNAKGFNEAFHIYSMKQAIEEGFILDVLQNYITYETFYRLNKKIEDDPKLQTSEAKRQIARFIDLHEVNIGQRIEVIIEHFRNCVMNELGGNAKAMVITSSREAAVKYRMAFEDYISRKNYKDIKALVAFSGSVKIGENSYTEPGMNGFSEKKLTTEFDKDEYRILLVADKYQTGFDQKKLCAMYVLKTLKGVAAVQTLSRLNRICPPFDKKTVVLDFVNDYDEIEKAYSKYYTTTLLANSTSPESLYELEAKIDGYYILDPEHIEKFNECLYAKNINLKNKSAINYYLQKAKHEIESKYDANEQKEILLAISTFVRCYDFIVQVSCFSDIELHKKFNFLSYLKSFLRTKSGGAGFNLDGMLKASGFVQKKKSEHKKTSHKSDPIVKLPTADSIVLTPSKEERLSKIIAEINSRTGKNYDNDVAIKAMLQIKDILLKSDKLKTSAKNNTIKDFEFSYFDDIDDALIRGLEHNKDFFTLLLNDKDIKKEVLGIFTEEIYKSLKNA